MTLLRRLTIALVVLLLIGISWIWWNRPHTIDMAANAPADSLIYLEANSATKIAGAVTSVDAWRQLAPLFGLHHKPSSSWWLRFMSWTGIGPTRSVVATRAQVAMVMLDLTASEAGDTLTVKPNAAIIIETHTASWRISSTTEKLIGELATAAYSTPTFTRQETSGIEFLIWRAPSGARQIVATIDGSVVIVGNSQDAVNACLTVRKGLRPSLKDSPELQKMRREANSDQALAFGYVSSGNAARLVSVAAPLLLGRESSNSSIERVIAGAAAKMLGSMAWSSFASDSGIEDRYLFSLQPGVVNRLQPVFLPAAGGDRTLDKIIGDVYSQSTYRFESTENAWTGFEDAVLSQLDAVSAVVFETLLKSALLTYGIKDPRSFVGLIGPHVATVRMKPASERSVLIAEIKDREALYRLITGLMSVKTNHGRAEVLEAQDEGLAAAFLDSYIILGPPGPVRECVDLVSSNEKQSRLPKAFDPGRSPAVVITYTNESERVRTFMQALGRTSSNNPGSRGADVERILAELPYTTTETTLTEEGLGRTTRSSFGQFGTLATLLFSTASEASP